MGGISFFSIIHVKWERVPRDINVRSALYMKYRSIGTKFVWKNMHDFRCWPDNCPEFRQNLKGLRCYGKIIELPGPDIHDFGLFFVKEAQFVISKRSVPEETPVFPGFFLGSFLDCPVPMDDHVVVVPGSIDLNPPVSCSHLGWLYILISSATNIYIFSL